MHVILQLPLLIFLKTVWLSLKNNSKNNSSQTYQINKITWSPNSKFWQPVFASIGRSPMDFWLNWTCDDRLAMALVPGGRETMSEMYLKGLRDWGNRSYLGRCDTQLCPRFKYIFSIFYIIFFLFYFFVLRTNVYRGWNRFDLK